MTDRERVEKIRLFLKFNKKTFSEVLGYTTPQSYTSYLNSSNNLSMKMIKALKKHDPRISIDWILTGEGQMLLNRVTSGTIQKAINRNGTIKQINGNDNGEVELLKVENESLKKEIKSLRKEVKLLEKFITDKERLISLLEKNQK